MRFDTPIFFQRVNKGEYNAKDGNYGPAKVTETMRRASVTDTGAETLQLVYGQIKQGSKTIRLQRHYNLPFDRIRIGDNCYKADRVRTLRNMQTLVVSEVQ